MSPYVVKTPAVFSVTEAENDLRRGTGYWKHPSEFIPSPFTEGLRNPHHPRALPLSPAWIKALGAIHTLQRCDRQSWTWMQLYEQHFSPVLEHLRKCVWHGGGWAVQSPITLSSCSDLRLPFGHLPTPMPISTSQGPFSLPCEGPRAGLVPTWAIFPWLVQSVVFLCTQHEPWYVLNSQAYCFLPWCL